MTDESMPEAPNEGGNEPGESTPDASGDFKPITSQEELNRIIGERVRRAKPGDYEELREKAARLDEIEESNKSELTKVSERADAAERERDAAVAEALRLRVAAKHGITDEDADLFLTGTDEETLTRQAERLAARSDSGPRAPKPDPNQGRTSTGRVTTADQFAATVGELL